MTVLPRSEGQDAPVAFGADETEAPRELFELSKNESGVWEVGEGWIYCGLKKVDVGAATLGQKPDAAYLNVTEDGGEFKAEVSSLKAANALVSIELYKFKDGELDIDGRNVMFIPLYN